MDRVPAVKARGLPEMVDECSWCDLPDHTERSRAMGRSAASVPEGTSFRTERAVAV